MARNKHPEETVNLILDTAFRLFMEKGYEYTSVQDIINNLGGLSKGAIYHHFKSKEDILYAVTDRMTSESNKILAGIRDASSLNGKDKLKTIFKMSLNRPVMDDIFTVAPNFNNNSKLLFNILNETIYKAAPDYILPIIKQGISDGSIKTEYPEQLAELIILVAIICLNTIHLQYISSLVLSNIIGFIQMMDGFGLDIIDDEILDRITRLADIYEERK